MDLGINWCVLTDNDTQGIADQNHARNYAGAGSPAGLLHVMPEDNIERYLCSVGFGSVYEGCLSRQTKPRVTVAKGDPQYWPQVLKAIENALNKPAAALRVAALIHSGAVPVPPLLEQTIRAAVALAGGA